MMQYICSGDDFKFAENLIKMVQRHQEKKGMPKYKLETKVKRGIKEVYIKI